MNWSVFWIFWTAAFGTYDFAMFARSGDFLFLVFGVVMVVCLFYWVHHYNTRSH